MRGISLYRYQHLDMAAHVGGGIHPLVQIRPPFPIREIIKGMRREYLRQLWFSRYRRIRDRRYTMVSIFLGLCAVLAV